MSIILCINFSSTDKNIKIVRLDVLTEVRTSTLHLCMWVLIIIYHFVYLKQYMNIIFVRTELIRKQFVIQSCFIIIWYHTFQNMYISNKENISFKKRKFNFGMVHFSSHHTIFKQLCFLIWQNYLIAIYVNIFFFIINCDQIDI